MKDIGVFYEKVAARLGPPVIIGLICVIALFFPIFAVNAVLRCLLISVFVFGFVLAIKEAFYARPVIVFEENGILFRGVRPGKWKLFQLWVTEQISDITVSSVRIGSLREKAFGGTLTYTPGEPSKGARFQVFLWIKYKKCGKDMDLYYPHLINVSDYRALIVSLEKRYGSRVEKFNFDP